MRRILSHIQEQPRSVRDTYAFWGAVLCTGVIALLWMWQSDFSQLAAERPADRGAAPVAMEEQPDAERTWPLQGFIGRLQAAVSGAWSDDGVDE